MAWPQSEVWSGTLHPISSLCAASTDVDSGDEVR